MKNKFTIEDNKVFIELSRRKFPNTLLLTTVDIEDFDLVNSYAGRWVALTYKRKSDESEIHYAGISIQLGIGKHKYHCLHDILMDLPMEHIEVEVDHIDRNSLNNCRINLRVVSRQINSFNHIKSIANRSGTTGVCFHRPTGKWRAYITPNGKQKHLGLFASKELAIVARKEAEKEFK